MGVESGPTGAEWSDPDLLLERIVVFGSPSIDEVLAREADGGEVFLTIARVKVYTGDEEPVFELPVLETLCLTEIHMLRRKDVRPCFYFQAAVADDVSDTSYDQLIVTRYGVLVTWLGNSYTTHLIPI